MIPGVFSKAWLLSPTTLSSLAQIYLRSQIPQDCNQLSSLTFLIFTQVRVIQSEFLIIVAMTACPRVRVQYLTEKSFFGEFPPSSEPDARSLASKKVSIDPATCGIITDSLGPYSRIDACKQTTADLIQCDVFSLIRVINRCSTSRGQPSVFS